MVRCSEVYQVNSGFLRKGIPENSRRQGNLRVGGFKAATSTYHKYLHFSADEFIAGLKRARCRLARPSWRACEQYSFLFPRGRWTALERNTRVTELLGYATLFNLWGS